MLEITLDKAMIMWFEMKYKTYDKLDDNDSIYLYYDGEEYADIRIDTDIRKIDYTHAFYYEFYSMFYVGYSKFQEILCIWAKDKFNLPGVEIVEYPGTSRNSLEIPL